MYRYSKEGDVPLNTRWSKDNDDMELTFRRPDDDYIRTADIHQLYQNSIIREHNSRMNNTHCNIENARMIERKRLERERARREDLEYDHVRNMENEEAQRQEQQELLNRRLRNKSIAQAQLKQVSEKELEKRRQRHQEVQERVRLNESLAQDARILRRKNQDIAENKKRELEARAEEILGKRLDRAREEQLLQVEEQKIELDRLDLEEKRRQRKADQAEKFKQLQIPKEIVSEKLAAFKNERAIDMSLREQQRLEREVAEIEAGRANRSAMEARGRLKYKSPLLPTDDA
ncbi:hypothetical protein GBF38_013484 [Nibea albiflora]|uniref:Uncharacterized protein n=1 Tax=Nibea albiflora TaxID=240163 RepID=A0ACB7F1J2_NIBAL|nr:hypothetical protein GBF38_013484 [Nibea albiflora]